MGGLIEGILFLVVGSGLCFLSLGFHDGGPIALSPALFPVIVTSAIAILGLSLILQEIKGRTVSPDSSSPAVSSMGNMWRVFLLSLLYAFLLPYLHFVPATFFYLVIFFFLTGERRVSILTVLSAGTVASVYLIFQKALSVLLP